MKEMGLKSILKRKFVITTDSKHTFPIFEYLLNRDFNSLKLGEEWVSDITYIRVENDWNYLTTVLDLADRKMVDWSLSQDMTTQNIIVKAWCAACKKRTINLRFVFIQIEEYNMP
jgi:putative transposase